MRGLPRPTPHSFSWLLSSKLPHSSSLVWEPNGNPLQAQLPCPSFLSCRPLHPAHPASVRELWAEQPLGTQRRRPQRHSRAADFRSDYSKSGCLPGLRFPACEMERAPQQGHLEHTARARRG